VLVLIHFIRDPGVQPAGSKLGALARVLGQRISALYQAVLDYPVKGRAVVRAVASLLNEVFNMFGGGAGEELDHYLFSSRHQAGYDIVVITSARRRKGSGGYRHSRSRIRITQKVGLDVQEHNHCGGEEYRLAPGAG